MLQTYIESATTLSDNKDTSSSSDETPKTALQYFK